MTFTYTENEMTTVRIIEKFHNKVITDIQASEALSCSVRTTYRKLQKFRAHGPKGLLHGLRGKTSNNRGDKRSKLKPYALKKKFDGFGPTLLAESLEEELGRGKVCVESLRGKMIERGIWSVKKRHISVMREKRIRRSKMGMMIQFDGSYHDRRENGKETCLLLAIDDATGKLMKGYFSAGETLEEMIVFWKAYFEKYGKPEVLYVDRHATYKVNHAQDQFDEEMLTRFQRAMRRLNVTIIYAKEAQGKGRVERAFRTLQDRLIKKMRLAKVKNIEQAQEYLDNTYIPEHNEKYAVEALESGDMHQTFTTQEQERYIRYFAKESERKVKRDGTVQYKRRIYQIPKGARLYRGDSITVYENNIGEIEIWSGKARLEAQEV